MILLGGILLVGYAAHTLGGRVHVPRVTLLLLLGIFAGPEGLDLVPDSANEWFPLVTNLALAMVGFLLGERLSLRELKKNGRLVLAVSVGVTLVTALLVFVAILVLRGDLVLALLLAGIAPATAPAATLDVIREFRARGRLTETILKVVAIDDAWCAILFSIALVVAQVYQGSLEPTLGLTQGLLDVSGALALGGLLGVPMAWLTGRLRPGEPTILEATGFTFLCAGLALLVGVSYLLACIALGAMVANLARHHVRPFRAVEKITDPFLVLFFFLAGYRLDIQSLIQLGTLSVVYILGRAAGRVAGGYWGARLGTSQDGIKTQIGWCLLPQAGVSLGLALLAIEHFPNLSGVLLPVIIASTVVFEIVGPIVTYRQLRLAGETT